MYNKNVYKHEQNNYNYKINQFFFSFLQNYIRWSLNVCQALKNFLVSFVYFFWGFFSGALLQILKRVFVDFIFGRKNYRAQGKETSIIFFQKYYKK
jgi:hypothetical protein